MAQRIFLVRHGRSAHVQAGAIDLDGFGRWREAYEAAGIDAQDQPPAALKELASRSGVIVASTAARAVESAKRLDAAREVTTSPLLQELELAPLRLRWLRLPLLGWALLVGLRSLARRMAAAEVERAREAAEWLSELAERHETVLAVTHHSLRSLLSRQLIECGWRCAIPKGRSRNWSVWELIR